MRETGNEPSEVWYGDLRRTSVRPLGDEDRRLIRSLCLRYGWGSGIVWAVTPFLFLFGLAAMAVLTERVQMGVLLLLAFLVPLAVFVTLASRWGRLRKRLRQDAAQGFVNQYQNDGNVLEVLPISNRVWRVNGEWVSKYHDTMAQQTIAPTPEEARKAALPLSYTMSKGFRGVTEKERLLTDAEVEELRRLARREWLQPLLPAVLLTLWFWPLTIILLADGRSPLEPAQFSFVGTMAVGAEAYFFRSLLQSARMRQDMRQGRVRRTELRAAAVADGGVTADTPDVQETLPVSGLLWTVGGRPAGWRRVREWKR